MQSKIRLAVVSIASLTLAVLVLVWNEARKEVYYLCGNFGPGVSEQSVLSQLETGNLLSYRTASSDDGGGVIVVSSVYAPGAGDCIIELNRNRAVRESNYQ